ncbi:hypothetical protein QQS21_004115 [Conoideocrella luteorostrata]|uniref:C2H2-type domain-containing protein n=1 Tax=Conoideocrella luteorostrata TaxID=1105319 RepID=A0AAJ0CW98_9HYPO|nr:hypothetical protein QQS21_004115 [Conoideocrella luteorostrata]
MEAESNIRLDLDESRSICGRIMVCPSAGTIFPPVASAAYGHITPTSNYYESNSIGLDFEDIYSGAGHDELTASYKHMIEYKHSDLVNAESQYLPFNQRISTTSSKGNSSILSSDYNHLFETSTTSNHNTDYVQPLTASSASTISPTVLELAPIKAKPNSLSSLQYSNESTIPLFPQKGSESPQFETINLDGKSGSSLCTYQLSESSSSQKDAHEKAKVRDVERNATALQCVQNRASGKLDELVNAAPPPTCKCDYPTCHKAFRRSEHLKRHKQTFHGEKSSCYSCEFCGKSNFSRQDNLNNHRKLHARANSIRRRGVSFVPHAVAIIEEEERSRRRRRGRREPVWPNTTEKQVLTNFCS